jgi:DNA-directed RNA polymerase specialized sigma24 family protein
MPSHNHDTRSLTSTGLARLLARLDPDRDQAAIEYEHLRRALIKFFDWRGVWPPEECADETIDRLSRKLEQITVENVKNYAHGIARLVLLERRRGPVFSSIDAEPIPGSVSSPETSPSEQDDQRQECFDECLAQVQDDGRSLLLSYYKGERQGKIANRRQLAVSLGVSESALRNRVQRLRDRIDHCVQACVSTRTETSVR